MKDPQAKAVYAWENAIIAPLSKGAVPFDQAQAFVDGVWLAHGWRFPPEVTLMPKQARVIMATGSRGRLQLPESTPDWVVLHELAHTLTSNEDGHGGRFNDGHGPDFVGVYIRLLERVLEVPALMSMYTLTQAGIKFNLAAIPWMQRRG